MDTTRFDIDITEVIWNLLSQWKMILVTAIAMSILVSGLKYMKDSMEYNAKMQEEQMKQEEARLPAEERIDKILEPLSDEDKTVVMYIVRQQELLRQQEEYLEDSIMINTNPANQRLLTIHYYIKGEEGIDLKVLCDIYTSLVQSTEVVSELREVIAPDVDLPYISELITTDNGVVEDSSATGTIYKVAITLPEETDASSVEQIITKMFTANNASLNKEVGSHRISVVHVLDEHKYNSVAMDRRGAINNTINNLQNNIRNNRTVINSEQQTALNAVSKINNEAHKQIDDEGETTEDAANTAGINPVFMVLGFLMGIIMYAFVYLLVLLYQKRIMSVKNAVKYTDSRLLGDIYYEEKKGLLSVLMSSAIVDKLRYGEKNDIERQKNLTINKLKAACEHADTDTLTVLNLIGEGGEAAKILDSLVQSATEKGIHTIKVDMYGEIDENEFLKMHDAVSIVGNNSKAAGVMNLAQLCKTYDIKQIGCVYLGRK